MEQKELQEKENLNSTIPIELGTIVRVADKFYQYLEMVDKTRCWVYRELQGLKQDNFNFSTVKKYKGFTVCPDFINPKSEIKGWLNLFEPLTYEPKEGEFPTIEKLFKHIFEEQLELGYDRFSILLRYPEHLQPILVLASTLQSTAKSTFLNFTTNLFKGNSVIINISEFSQKFNSLYASKLCIGIDETIISEQFIKERLKQYSTAKSIQLRLMHKDYTSIPFYGKFTLCTNKELNFAKIENDDQRFWLRIPSQIQDFDPFFEEKLTKEIPYFLHFLLNRTLSVPVSQSRMWFTKEQLHTDALTKVINNSKSDCAKDIEIFFEEELERQNRDSIGATATEIFNCLNNKKHNLSNISYTLKHEMKIENINKSYYDLYNQYKIGRAYIFNRKNDDSSF